ncbi:lipopolysaccharide biosynthesis protein [Desulfosoma sp.]|uniref:lipopolysaccharide biosynthesis protein n=1 Tax=Desulfosoma sp. TaxID=2603217 RepID=UPI00404B4E2E
MSWKKEFLKNAVWVILISNLMRAFSFIGTLILARILSPSDYGVVGIALAVTTFVEMLGDFGFSIYLVQKNPLEKTDLDTVWTCQVCVGVLQAVALGGSASLVASFYRLEALFPVLLWLSASSFILGLKNVGVVLFQKEMQFIKEFHLRVTPKMIGVVLAIFTAYFLGNYWAIIVGVIAQRACEVVLSYVVTRFRPRFCLDKIRDVMKFSLWVYINTSLVFIANRSGELLLGKFNGSVSAGIYSLSYSVATLITSELAEPIGRVSLPAYSKMRRDLGSLSEGYLHLLSGICFIALPLSMGIAITAPVSVPLLLGRQWVEAVLPLQILSMAAFFRILQSNWPSIFLASGRPQPVTWLLSMKVLVFLPSFSLFARHWGTVGGCMAVLISEAIMAPTSIFFCTRFLRLSLWDVWGATWRAFFGGAVMGFSLWWIMTQIKLQRFFDSQLFVLVFLCFVGACLYFMTLFSLWRLSSKKDISSEHNLLNVLSILRDKLRGIVGGHKSA